MLYLKSLIQLQCDKCGKKTMKRIGVFTEDENLIGFIGKNCICGNKEKADLKEIDEVNQKLL